MAYVKQEWKDEVLNGPEQYNITAPGTNINGAEITLSTPIIQAGTQVTAERMNKIEQGIFDAHEMFSEGVWTPVLAGLTTAGNYTYSARKGIYKRSGKIIFVMFDFTVSGVTAAGTGLAVIKGFPAILAPADRGVNSINFVSGSFQYVNGFDITANGFALQSFSVVGTQIKAGYSAGILSPSVGSRIIGAAIYPAN